MGNGISAKVVRLLDVIRVNVRIARASVTSVQVSLDASEATRAGSGVGSVNLVMDPLGSPITRGDYRFQCRVQAGVGLNDLRTQQSKGSIKVDAAFNAKAIVMACNIA